MTNLSIVIPAYNEEARIGATLLNFSNFLQKQPNTYEILVVDDGSTDKTVELVQSLQLTIRHLRVLKLETNKGKGQAVRVGMLAALGEINIFSDADGSTPIEDLPHLIAPIMEGKADISIGSRYLSTSTIVKAQPFYRRLWSRLANKIVQGFLLPGIVDPNCGFKAYSSKASKTIFSQCTINEWSFDLEALCLARNLNFIISEVPVSWTNDDRSKGKIRQVPREIFNLIIIRKRVHHLYHPI